MLEVAGERQDRVDDFVVTLAGLLHAYDVQRVVTSPSTRCLQTVAPYAGLARVIPEKPVTLSEEAGDDTTVTDLAAGLLGGLERPTVICSHRPVLPWVFAGLGSTDPKLEKGEIAVLHVRDGVVQAVETHQA